MEMVVVAFTFVSILFMIVIGWLIVESFKTREIAKGAAASAVQAVAAINTIPDIPKVQVDPRALIAQELMMAPPGNEPVMALRSVEWREWDDDDHK